MPATVMIFGAIYRSMDGLQKFETSVRQAARPMNERLNNEGMIFSYLIAIRTIHG